MTEEAFCQAYPHAALAVRAEDPEASSLAFLTLAAAGNRGEAGDPSAPQDLTMVWAVKGGANPFGQWITLGRALNNDVVLKDTEISKFHAYLTPGEDGWTLTDAGSTNGTFLDGERLAAQETRPVANGETFVVGSTQVTLLQHSIFYRYLQLLG